MTATAVFEPLGGKTLSQEKPLVLVHPWWLFGADPEMDKYYRLENPRSNTSNVQGGYLKNLEKFLRFFRGDIYLLESPENVASTVDRLQIYRGNLNGISLLRTFPHGSRSPNCDNDEELDFLKSKASEVYFAGGRINHYHEKSGLIFAGGCLGDFASRFSWIGGQGKFIDGCCFD